VVPPEFDAPILQFKIKNSRFLIPEGEASSKACNGADRHRILSIRFPRYGSQVVFAGLWIASFHRLPASLQSFAPVTRPGRSREYSATDYIISMPSMSVKAREADCAYCWGLTTTGMVYAITEIVKATPYPEVNELLDLLLSRISNIFGDKLIGLYLYGSLVWGDFDESSDIDLLAAVASDVDDAELASLKEMHAEIARKYEKWDNRIEVQYLSLEGLRTFKTRATRMAVTSPGEPFHVVDAGKEWLLNWYPVQEKGVALFGPPPETIIEPVSKAEFIHASVEHIKEWQASPTSAMDSRPAQSFRILTACRALYLYRNGNQVSKKQAALWAAKEFPQWSSLIRNALVWRDEAVQGQDKEVDPAATYPETKRFIRFVSDQISVE
jgi:predicted nucleotidyltransferase